MIDRIFTSPFRLIVPGLLSLLQPRKGRLPEPLIAQRDERMQADANRDDWLFEADTVVNRATEALSWELDRMSETLGRVRMVLSHAVAHVPMTEEHVGLAHAQMMDDEALFDGVAEPVSAASLEIWGEADELFHDHGVTLPSGRRADSLQQVA